jgi:hypothetical protein
MTVPNFSVCLNTLRAPIAQNGVIGQPAERNALAVQTLHVFGKKYFPVAL